MSDLHSEGKVLSTTGDDADFCLTCRLVDLQRRLHGRCTTEWARTFCQPVPFLNLLGAEPGPNPSPKLSEHGQIPWG